MARLQRRLRRRPAEGALRNESSESEGVASIQSREITPSPLRVPRQGGLQFNITKMHRAHSFAQERKMHHEEHTSSDCRHAARLFTSCLRVCCFHEDSVRTRPGETRAPELQGPSGE